MYKIREKKIVKAGYIGIGTNLLLATFKAIIGLMAGSIAIVLDSINNVTDIFSSVVTIIGVKLANKPADKEHPFGHGRIEYIVTVVVAAVILGAGLISMYESIQKIIHPQILLYDKFSFIVLVVAIITKIVLSKYLYKVGYSVKSETLTITAKDAGFDAIVTTSTLIAAIVDYFLGQQLVGVPIDGMLGCLISVIIIKSGWQMILRPISELVGKTVPHKVALNITETVLNYNKVKGVYDLILHNYGPNYIEGSVYIGVDYNMTAYNIHLLTKKIQKTIIKEYGIKLNIGVYAIYPPTTQEGEMQNKITQLAHNVKGVIEAHGVFINTTTKQILLDIVVDYSLCNKQEVFNEVYNSIHYQFPEYNLNINLEVDNQYIIN